MVEDIAVREVSLELSQRLINLEFKVDLILKKIDKIRAVQPGDSKDYGSARIMPGGYVRNRWPLRSGAVPDAIDPTAEN